MNLSYRQSTEDEWSIAYDLTRDNMAAYYAASGRTWDTSVFRESWPTTENLTLEVADKIVGFLRMARSDQTLWIRDIQVREAAQGNGIGTFALGLAERMARGRGVTEIRLNVFDGNPALRLYLNHGFWEVTHHDEMRTLAKRVGEQRAAGDAADRRG